MGRFEQILGTLAVITLSQGAFAQGEPPSQPSPLPTPETSEPPSKPQPRIIGPRVIWAAPGTAPPRPQLAQQVTSSPPPNTSAFDLTDTRILVGLERASSIARYRVSVSPPEGSDTITSGVEASVIGSTEREPLTPLVMPRLSLDTRLTDVLSVGLSFSYAAHSAESSSADRQRKLPASESLLIGPRLGWFRPLSSKVAFWLRGGPTFARRASSAPTDELGQERDVTEQHWALSFEPQLLVMPLSHVGFSFGAAMDIGVTGDARVSYSGDARQRLSRSDMVASTYGFTAGLVAMF